MTNVQRIPGLLSILLLTAAVGCGGSSGTASTGAGGGSTSSGDGGSGGGATSGTGGSTSSGGDTSVDAKLPSGEVAFSGSAAAFYINSTKTDLQIIISEGDETCGASGNTNTIAAGQHDLELYLVGVAGTSPPFAAMTYSDTNGASTSVHAEANLTTPCGNVTLAANGGESPFSVTVTSIDATQVTGTFSMTMTEHVNAGKQFPMTGSFVAPICNHGIVPSCK